MNGNLILILLAVLCMVVGAIQIMLWTWRGVKTFLRKPTTIELRDYTGRH